MYPGATALTVTPSAAHSRAMTRMSWLRPPLVAAYGAWCGCASSPDTDDMNTIRPYPLAHITLPTAWPSQ